MAIKRAERLAYSKGVLDTLGGFEMIALIECDSITSRRMRHEIKRRITLWKEGK